MQEKSDDPESLLVLSKSESVCIAKYYFTSNGFGFHLNTPIYDSSK